MNAILRRSGRKALTVALRTALQWRLLLLWLLGSLLPTLLTTLPVWGWLQWQFGHSLYAADIAAGRNLPLLLETLFGLRDQSAWLGLRDQAAWLGGGAILGLALTLLLSPWLTGMLMVAIRSGRRLDFAALLQGGLGEYGRMLRMLLWSVIPLGIAIAIGAGALVLAREQAEHAVLVSQARTAIGIALGLLAVLAVLAHASVEAGRGWLAADPDLRSVLRAWWRGCRLLQRRPLAMLAVYLGASVIGCGLALILGLLRLQVDGTGWPGFVGAFVLTQCTVAMLAWGRIARLHGLADLAADALAQEAMPRPAASVTERRGPAYADAEAV